MFLLKLNVTAVIANVRIIQKRDCYLLHLTVTMKVKGKPKIVFHPEDLHEEVFFEKKSLNEIAKKVEIETRVWLGQINRALPAMAEFRFR